MPIYEYVCLDCYNNFDALRAMKEADVTIACPKCQGDHTSRRISVFFAHSDGRTITQSSGGCASCGGGTCSTCASG